MTRNLILGLTLCALLFAGCGADRESGRAPLIAEERSAPLEFRELDKADSDHPLASSASTLVIEDDASWAQFWTAHTATRSPTPPLPPVDFNTSFVVASFHGPSQVAGARTEVTQAVRNDLRGVVIRVEDSAPTGGAPTPGTPSQVVRVSKLGQGPVGTVQFDRIRVP